MHSVSRSGLMTRRLAAAPKVGSHGRPLARRLPAQPGQALEHPPLLPRTRLRRRDLEREEQVPAPTPAEIRNALPAKAVRRAGRRPRIDVDALGSVERVDLHLGAEGRLHHRNIEAGEQIRPASFEHWILVDAQRHVQIAGSTAPPSRVARTGDAEVEPVRHAGGDVDRHRGVDWDAAPPVAPLTRRDDLLAGPLARRAGVCGHHGAEDASSNVLHLAGASTRPASLRRRSRFGPRTGTAIAWFQSFELDLATNAERGLAEGQARLREHVLTVVRSRAARCGSPATERAGAEERLEDVGDVAERKLPDPPARPVQVVLLPSMGIRKDLVRRGDLLETLFGGGIGVHVGVELPRESAVRLLDVVVRRIASDTEDLVEVADLRHVLC